MIDYCRGALDFLSHAYDERTARFSYSTRITEGALVNDFSHPQTLRYTINTYLGLAEAERHLGPIDWLGDVAPRVDAFISLHGDALDEHADLGLLLVLLASVAPDHPAVGRSLGRIAEAVATDGAARRLDMQDLGWMLWGALATRTDARADAVADRVFTLMRTRYVYGPTGLPRHSLSRYRKSIVSFGSLVYYLRATHEYAERFGDAAARGLFLDGARRALALQREDGGWPWLIDIRTAAPIDVYPIFSVHQDSMAMLWLFPAARGGLPGADRAIESSLRWNLGDNELGAPLIREDPCFFAYRSIERDEGQPRLRRYVRSLVRAPAESDRVRLNRECRSYHLGWVLYAWSSRVARPSRPDSGAAAISGRTGVEATADRP